MTSDRPLTGRERELDLVSRTVARQGVEEMVLLLVGDAGIGKSAILGAAAREAESQGALVLKVVGVEAEAALPFAGLQQLLAGLMHLMSALPEAERDGLLSALGLRDTPGCDPFLIAEASASLLAIAARRRALVIVADDLQWLDPQSYDILSFIARRAGRAGIVVVGGVRTGYDHLPMMAGRQMVLAGLEPPAAEELLIRRFPHLRQFERDQIRREAMGNPLALLELPASRSGAVERKREPGQTPALSTKLERAFASRTRTLSDSTRDVILVAAVDHSDNITEILTAAAILHGQPVDSRDLQAAEQADVLRRSGDRVSFRHPLVRSGVLQHESAARQQAANAALAAVVHEPYRRTWHLAQSILGPDDAVAAALEDVATESAHRGALHSAIRSLERAAQLSSVSAKRGQRLLAAAEHAFDLGRADLVDALLTAARRTDLSRLDSARMAWLREVFNDGTPGDATRVHELCGFASRAAAGQDLDLALNLLLAAGLRCWWADTGPNAREHVVSVASSLPAQQDARLPAILAVTDPIRQGAAVLALLGRVSPADAGALRLCGMAAHAVGDSPRAATYLDAAAAQLREQSRLGLLAHVLSMSVIVRLEIGDLVGALAAVEEGLHLAQETGQPIWTTGTLVCSARAEAMRGNAVTALEMATRAELAANQRQLNDLLACVQLARGLALLDEHLDRSFACFRSMFDPDSPSFHQRQRFDAVMFLAETAVRTGRREEARTIVKDLEQVALVTPSPLLHAHLMFARAVLADDEVAEQRYLDALEPGALTGWPWVRGRLHQAFAGWLHTAGRVEEARTHRAAARQIYIDTGAKAWLDQLDAQVSREGDPTT